MLTVLFIAQKQQQNSSTLDVNLKPLSPWLFLKKKKKTSLIVLFFFLLYPLLFKKNYKKQLINTPTLLVLFFLFPSGERSAQRKAFMRVIVSPIGRRHKDELIGR